MTGHETGWAWFDEASASSDGELLKPDMELAVAFAKCFLERAGEQVLEYLRSLTLKRALGPNAADAFLRHIEGQRQLVAHIIALVERGRGNAHDS